MRQQLEAIEAEFAQKESGELRGITMGHGKTFTDNPTLSPEVADRGFKIGLVIGLVGLVASLAGLAMGETRQFAFSGSRPESGAPPFVLVLSSSSCCTTLHGPAGVRAFVESRRTSLWGFL